MQEDGTVDKVVDLSASGICMNGGFFVFRNEIFHHIKEGEELVNEPFARLIEARQLMTRRYDGFWKSMDSLKDKQQYIGFTTNIEKGIKNHNEGGTISTSKRRPLELIYCEFYMTKADAMQRERYFKTTKGKRTLKLMLQNTHLAKEMV